MSQKNRPDVDALMPKRAGMAGEDRDYIEGVIQRKLDDRKIEIDPDSIHIDVHDGKITATRGLNDYSAYLVGVNPETGEAFEFGGLTDVKKGDIVANGGQGYNPPEKQRTLSPYSDTWQLHSVDYGLSKDYADRIKLKDFVKSKNLQLYVIAGNNSLFRDGQRGIVGAHRDVQGENVDDQAGILAAGLKQGKSLEAITEEMKAISAANLKKDPDVGLRMTKVLDENRPAPVAAILKVDQNSQSSLRIGADGIPHIQTSAPEKQQGVEAVANALPEQDELEFVTYGKLDNKIRPKTDLRHVMAFFRALGIEAYRKLEDVIAGDKKAPETKLPDGWHGEDAYALAKRVARDYKNTNLAAWDSENKKLLDVGALSARDVKRYINNMQEGAYGEALAQEGLKNFPMEFKLRLYEIAAQGFRSNLLLNEVGRMVVKTVTENDSEFVERENFRTLEYLSHALGVDFSRPEAELEKLGQDYNAGKITEENPDYVLARVMAANQDGAIQMISFARPITRDLDNSNPPQPSMPHDSNVQVSTGQGERDHMEDNHVVASNLKTIADPKAHIRALITGADTALSESRGSDDKSGTTATAAIVQDGKLTVGNAGDSPAVLYVYDEATKQVEAIRLVKEHNIEKNIDESVRRAEIAGIKARNGDVGHIKDKDGNDRYGVLDESGRPSQPLSRSIGDSKHCRGVTAEPEISQYDIAQYTGKGKRAFLVVGSDGLGNKDIDIENYKRMVADAVEKGQGNHLAEKFTGSESAKNTKDNVTALVAELKSDSNLSLAVYDGHGGDKASKFSAYFTQKMWNQMSLAPAQSPVDKLIADADHKAVVGNLVWKTKVDTERGATQYANVSGAERVKLEESLKALGIAYEAKPVAKGGPEVIAVSPVEWKKIIAVKDEIAQSNKIAEPSAPVISEDKPARHRTGVATPHL
jgi:serine/threonine protein phosphatase PrpC